MWDFTGQKRPPFAVEPKAGQESAWDYPRPPDIRPDHRLVVVRSGDKLIAESAHSLRVCETASPPTFYLPPDAVDMNQLAAIKHQTFCEWKGYARYWALAGDPERQPAAWSYPSPLSAFEAIRDWLCFYPARVACFVDGEAVRPQRSPFYGGWITDEVVGPFKGDPGTAGW